VLARLESVRLTARVAVEGHLTGQHRSPARGASVEFADHREYSPGDDTRHLDWRLYARAERDFVKQFDAETNLAVYILLDVSPSMAYPAGGVSKLRYGAGMAAGLAYLAWKQRDAPGLGLVDGALRSYLPPQSQRGHLARLLDVLDAVGPGDATALGRALEGAAAAIKRRGLLVLISDLWAPPEEAVRGLRFFRRQGHDVLVLHVLHPDELRLPLRGSWCLVEPETGSRTVADVALARQAYLAALGAHLAALRDGLRSGDVDYHLCDMGLPFDAALAQVLAGREGRR
jgi:uncharacterized protein (DUF58 family)